MGFRKFLKENIDMDDFIRGELGDMFGEDEIDDMIDDYNDSSSRTSEYIELGPTPWDESCLQVGSDEYQMGWRDEANRYIDQLKKLFGNKLVGSMRFGIKKFPHDFGTYHDVVIFYNNIDEEEIALEIEEQLPRNWE